MRVVYGSCFYKFWLSRQARRMYMRDVSVNVVPAGVIVNEHLRGFGVFDRVGRFVKSASQVRGNNGNFAPSHVDLQNCVYDDRDVIFLGNVYPAFGHFMLEHLNRAWVLLNKKYKNMPVVLINNKSVSPVPGYMYRFLELLGVARENIIILDNTTRFRSVIVPAQAYNLPIYSATEFGKTFDAMVKNINVAPKNIDKIYVSRTALQSRRTYGEDKIEKIFAKNGYTIIHPEKLSLDEQIAYASGAKYLAGCAGTALHLALFMRGGGTVIQIKRNRKHKDSAPAQYLINKTKGLKSIFINGAIEKTPTSHFSSIPQIVGVNKYMMRFIKDNNFKYSSADVAFDTDAWREYSSALCEYKRVHGGVFVDTIKHHIVRVAAWFVPGRARRSVFRRWLKRKLDIV